MLNRKIEIYSEFVTLQQLLKLCNVISSGGQAKVFLANSIITVNGERDNRRGRKLYVGDVIIINNEQCLTLVKK